MRCEEFKIDVNCEKCEKCEKECKECNECKKCKKAKGSYMYCECGSQIQGSYYLSGLNQQTPRVSTHFRSFSKYTGTLTTYGRRLTHVDLAQLPLLFAGLASSGRPVAGNPTSLISPRPSVISFHSI